MTQNEKFPIPILPTENGPKNINTFQIIFGIFSKGEKKPCLPCIQQWIAASGLSPLGEYLPCNLSEDDKASIFGHWRPTKLKISLPERAAIRYSKINYLVASSVDGCLTVVHPFIHYSFCNPLKIMCVVRKNGEIGFKLIILQRPLHPMTTIALRLMCWPGPPGLDSVWKSGYKTGKKP